MRSIAEQRAQIAQDLAEEDRDNFLSRLHDCEAFLRVCYRGIESKKMQKAADDVITRILDTMEYLKAVDLSENPKDHEESYDH